MMKRLLLTCLLCVLAPAMSFAASVQEIKTDNGFTIWLSEEHSLPLISASLLFTQAGTAYDPKGKEGRANMTASLLLEGAADRDSKAFNQRLEEYAIRLNVGADEETLGVSLNTLSEHRDIAFSMLADALIRPRFDADAIERARNQLLSVIAQQSGSPYYKLMRGWEKATYATHPYGQEALGNEKTIAALQAQDFKDYLNRYVSKENIIISLAGDITAEEAKRLFDQYFIGLPATRDADSTLEEFMVPATANQTTIPHDAPQTLIKFGFWGIKRDDPRYMTAYVLNHIIGGSGLGSILAQEIRIKRGLAYSVQMQLDPKDFSAEWAGLFSTKNSTAKEAVATLKQTLSDLQKNGVSHEQLAAAKSYLTGSFLLNLDSNGDIARFMTVMQRYKLGHDYLEKRNGMIEAITLEQVNAVLLEMLNPSRLRMVAVGKGEL